MSLITILLILFVAALAFGGFGGTGPYGWSPAGIIVLILIVLWATGRLN